MENVSWTSRRNEEIWILVFSFWTQLKDELRKDFAFRQQCSNLLGVFILTKIKVKHFLIWFFTNLSRVETVVIVWFVHKWSGKLILVYLNAFFIFFKHKCSFWFQFYFSSHCYFKYFLNLKTVNVWLNRDLIFWWSSVFQLTMWCRVLVR